MEKQKLHRGRLFDHVHLVVKDFDKSLRFYSTLFKSLDIPLGAIEKDYFWADEFFVSSQNSRTALGTLTGRVHLAFQAQDKEGVDRSFVAGLEGGGKDNGKPGERPYHPGYYAAFLLDPDGNNIEVVYHGPAKRSAHSVEISF